MTVPQSLLVLALVVAWLVVLVPSSSRRRGHVRQTVEGGGFRVLRRPEIKRRRFVRGLPATGSTKFAKIDSEAQMSSQPTHVGSSPAFDDTVVIPAVDSENSAGDDRESQDETARLAVAADQLAPDVDEPNRGSDDDEVRAQYQAWRDSTRTAEVPTDTEPSNVRPIPRRPGRGTYDPEAAERARAFKYARRRRAVLVLVLLIIGFTVAAVTLSAKLWIGVGVSALLLLLFMAYLRRQVKIEADIRERRLAKLERARQIRPERPQAAGQAADPYAHRAPRPSQASGSVHHRSSRTVVDLDDDDPAFDDLEQYEQMEYRRAVGQ